MITIEKSALQSVTAAVASLARKGAIHPVAELASLSCADGRLTIRATDLDNWLSFDVPVEGDMPSCQADAGKLADLVSNMKASTLKIDVVDGSLTIQGGGKRKLATMTVPFPDPEAPSGAPVLFEVDALRSDLAFAAQCMSDDYQAKATFCGVRVHSEDGRYHAAGFNGVGLAVATMGTASEDLAVTIAAATIRLLKWLPSGAQTELRVNDRLLSFTWSGGSLVSKIIEGGFPNYRAMLPVHDAALTTRADAIVSGMRAVAAVAADENASKSKRVELVLGPDVMVKTASQSGQAEEPIDAAWPGEPMTMFFASKRLEQAISGFGDVEIEIGITDYPDADRRKVKGVMTRAVGDDTRFTLLMPIS